MKFVSRFVEYFVLRYLNEPFWIQTGTIFSSIIGAKIIAYFQVIIIITLCKIIKTDIFVFVSLFVYMCTHFFEEAAARRVTKFVQKWNCTEMFEYMCREGDFTIFIFLSIN